MGTRWERAAGADGYRNAGSHISGGVRERIWTNSSYLFRPGIDISVEDAALSVCLLHRTISRRGISGAFHGSDYTECGTRAVYGRALSERERMRGGTAESEWAGGRLASERAFTRDDRNDYRSGRDGVVRYRHWICMDMRSRMSARIRRSCTRHRRLMGRSMRYSRSIQMRYMRAHTARQIVRSDSAVGVNARLSHQAGVFLMGGIGRGKRDNWFAVWIWLRRFVFF